MLRYFTFFIFVIALIVSITSTSSQENCAVFGFNPNTLMCSTCLQLRDIVPVSDAIKQCNECCVKKIEEKYKYAVLEVDKRFLKALPEIAAVVKLKTELNLKIRYRYGPNSLLMYKEKSDGEPAEVISVNTWSKDVFVDYLKTHLSL